MCYKRNLKRGGEKKKRDFITAQEEGRFTT